MNKTLLDMVAQDKVNSIELHVDIPMEVQRHDPLEFLPCIEALEEEPHLNNNVEHILELQEELRRVWATIEEQKKHIEDL